MVGLNRHFPLCRQSDLQARQLYSSPRRLLKRDCCLMMSLAMKHFAQFQSTRLMQIISRTLNKGMAFSIAVNVLI